MSRCTGRLCSLLCRLLLLLLAFPFLAGCQTLSDTLPIEEITHQATRTPTPNPTLLAIARMLTETASVPTATLTPIPTLTRVVTPTATVEVALEGSQKLPAPSGKPFILGNIALSILGGQTTQRAGRLKALEGQIFLDLEILMENQGLNPVSYTPFYLRLVGPGGQAFQPAVDSLRPGLLSGTLRPGERVRGHLAFALPQPEGELASSDFHLVFRPEWIDLPADSPLREAWIELLPLAAVKTGVPETGSSPADGMADWPAEDLPGLGQRVEASGIGLAVTDWAVKERVEFGKAGKGNQFIVLSVRIDNVNHPRLPYNPLYFRVKDRGGYEFLPTAGAPETSLQAGTLSPGQAVTGQLIFEVPLSDDRLVLSYQPTVIGEEYQEIRVLINVGQ